MSFRDKWLTLNKVSRWFDIQMDVIIWDCPGHEHPDTWCVLFGDHVLVMAHRCVWWWVARITHERLR